MVKRILVEASSVETAKLWSLRTQVSNVLRTLPAPMLHMVCLLRASLHYVSRVLRASIPHIPLALHALAPQIRTYLSSLLKRPVSSVPSYLPYLTLCMLSYLTCTRALLSPHTSCTCTRALLSPHTSCLACFMRQSQLLCSCFSMPHYLCPFGDVFWRLTAVKIKIVFR